jgi:hypothetical protein
MLRTLLPILGAFVVLVGAVFLGFEGRALLPFADVSQDRVLVFLVGNREGVDRVRTAVDPARVVAATEDAIALREGRIVAVNVAAVSDPYTAAGWLEREIEIFHVERAAPKRPGRSGGGEGTEVDPERMAKPAALVQKPTLSAGEQMFVLQTMNDGIEF